MDRLTTLTLIMLCASLSVHAAEPLQPGQQMQEIERVPVNDARYDDEAEVSEQPAPHEAQGYFASFRRRVSGMAAAASLAASGWWRGREQEQPEHEEQQFDPSTRLLEQSAQDEQPLFSSISRARLEERSREEDELATVSRDQPRDMPRAVPDQQELPPETLLTQEQWAALQRTRELQNAAWQQQRFVPRGGARGTQMQQQSRGAMRSDMPHGVRGQERFAPHDFARGATPHRQGDPSRQSQALLPHDDIHAEPQSDAAPEEGDPSTELRMTEERVHAEPGSKRESEDDRALREQLERGRLAEQRQRATQQRQAEQRALRHRQLRREYERWRARRAS